MYKIAAVKEDGHPVAGVIPVEMIRQSVHLIPVFGAVAPAHWKSSNVLDKAAEFLVNPFSDCYQYCTLL